MMTSRHGFETISANEEPACARGDGDRLNDVHLILEQLRHDAVPYSQFLRSLRRFGLKAKEEHLIDSLRTADDELNCAVVVANELQLLGEVRHRIGRIDDAERDLA